MYSGFLTAHSSLRYIVLFLLLAVIIRSLVGWMNGKPFVSLDNKFSLWLLIATHTQFLLGLTLYFISPFVQFGADTMKEKTLRYWSVEHVFMMLIAVVLITVARITHKKLADDKAKHKRLFILNAIALLIILVAILFSGRGLFNAPARM